MTRVVVLGAGFGGLEVSARLSESLGDAVEVVLVDRAESFVFGFSKLDVMFGRVPAEHVRHRYTDIVKPGVRLVTASVLAIDPVARRVETDAGTFDADVLVVALGADVHPEATPGLVEGGHEFYTVAGAFALRDALADFDGGRVVVGVTSTPFKCPPAPSETALLLDELLTRRGVRETSEITLVMPFGMPIPPSPAASTALLAAFGERKIVWHPEAFVQSLDPAARVAHLSDGSTLPYDLFLGVPVHRVPEVVAASGMTVDGWVPVDPFTLETRFPGVYAVGDVTSVGTPKAGVFAEGQGAVAADRIVSSLRGARPRAEYDGHGVCYLEVGGGEVGKVDVLFRPGERPSGALVGPSVDLAAEKSTFGATRVARWFGRTWSPLG
ncbi:NAD(P)/FAD-dependent oxidoreductase [Cellulomonas sp. P22]|uniref:NAD(P)/FAD-dependent oxidoreductase n=1 Tax=Cellulomonas sp. P22 TaxID=3373189 RepID=UPI0037991C0B